METKQETHGIIGITRKAFAALLDVASKEESHKSIYGIAVDYRHARLCATDGHRAAVFTVDHFPADSGSNVPAVFHLFSRPACEKAVKVGKSATDQIVLSVKADGTRFIETCGVTIADTAETQSFPDIDRVTPAHCNGESPHSVVSLNPVYFADAAKLGKALETYSDTSASAKKYSTSNPCACARVQTGSDELAPVRVDISYTSVSQSVVYVIMPMRA